MLRFFLLRIVLPLLVFLLVRAVLKSLWAAVQTSSPVPRSKESPAGGELKKDPVCGTYVAQGAAVTKKVGGEILHFCSTACRDRYKNG
ncbi:MAG: hypothetical protein M1436_00440 [Acidobacteria bacterium]|nr:hypothetical protein [Acidobacteriota bacterium]